MPYTPPAQRSPAASNPSSPQLSRRSSLLPGQPASPNSHRPEIPRSTSYLSRHRRTPSVKTTQLVDKHAAEPTPPATAVADNEPASTLHASASLRKSPPPVTDASQMPNGVVLSPPESAHNSSDDEDSEKERGRQIERLAELQAAIRTTIGQHRETSPVDRSTTELVKMVGSTLTLKVPTNEAELKEVTEKVECLLSPQARKISHTRSNTDSSLFMGDARRRNESSLTDSDDEDLDSSGSDSRKPPMLRKKSGELVRPALRPSSRRRPSSMPGTPTFSKAVHFDSHLEHVRHFLQVDRPLAVSAGSSPVEAHQSDTEFPFSDEDSSHQARSPPFEWEIVVANFPPETYERLQLPVRVERVFLSNDNKTLIGSIAVANLAFKKTVVARFTLDYWKTTSEVVAEYTNDVRRKKMADGYDRFNFTIKLADLANLEAKTMFFCVKYSVNGTEYWDNNNSTNFQVDFRKKLKPINGKKGSQSASPRGLPKSHKKAPVTADRPPAPTFDDFADGFENDSGFKFPYKPTHEYLSGAGRLKGVRSEVALSSDRFKKKPQSPNGQGLSNRYDFSASLNAAIQAANTTLGDKSGITMKGPPKKSPGQTPIAPPPAAAPAPKAEPAPAASMNSSYMAQHTSGSGTDSPRPAGTEQPSLASQSYNELLDKYCFFGSVKSSPQLKDGTLSNSRPGGYDGAADDYVLLDSESSSSPEGNNSPLMMQMLGASKRPAAAQRAQSAMTPRSPSPAPLTGYTIPTGSSPMIAIDCDDVPVQEPLGSPLLSPLHSPCRTPEDSS